jgi:DNA-binding CsgD family transcriptional regulator
VLDYDLRVLVRNRQAQTLLKEQDGLAEGAAGLIGRMPATTKALRDAVRQSSQSEGALILERRPPRRPLLATVTSGPTASGLQRSAVMFVKDPDQPVSASATTLSRLYGLTHAESQLAIRLMSGESVDEAAAFLGITVHTARTHLKRVLLKTDTNRQGQLIALLLNGPATEMRRS